MKLSALRLPIMVCALTAVTAAYALDNYLFVEPNVVTGSGAVIAEQREVEGFTRIALHTFGDVAVNVGEEFSLLVSAEDNLVPLLATDVRDGWLVIEAPDDLTLQATRPIIYMITMPALDGVDLSGAGSIHASHLREHAVAVTMDGIGTVALSGEVGEQTVKMSGTGRYNGFRLTCDHASITIGGEGSAELNVRRLLETSITGSGNVIYNGHPRVMQHVTGDVAVIHR